MHKLDLRNLDDFQALSLQITQNWNVAYLSMFVIFYFHAKTGSFDEILVYR